MTAAVVVAVDGTDDGRRALRFGIGLASTCGAPLRLVHVKHEFVMVTPMMPKLPDPPLNELAEQVLSEALADTRRMGWRGEDPETVLAHAPRVAAIVDQAADARCVVLGRRSSTVEHLFTGSTTNGVAANCASPVVCVPASWSSTSTSGLVSVGVDGSEYSVPVIEEAATTARELGARVLVMHAWRPFGQYDAAISGRTFTEQWERDTRPVIVKLVDQVRAGCPDVQIDVELRYARPVVALHELSQTSDLLVIGRHGHPHRFSPKLGTTARTVIRTSQCPVLLAAHSPD
jgi:nucleotide-binding universal stress UspA family protein